MISDEHECIFVHIPKTGGQSVESVFLDLHGLTWDTRAPLLLRPNPDPAKGPKRLAHLKAREYVELGYIDGSTFDRFLKFSFVRNPWARLVSEYRYLGLEDRIPFPAFVTDSLTELDDYSEIGRHLCPQIDFLTDVGGKIIVDFVGRFETFQDDFTTVARRLGVGDVTLPHRSCGDCSPSGGESDLAAHIRTITTTSSGSASATFTPGTSNDSATRSKAPSTLGRSPDQAFRYRHNSSGRCSSRPAAKPPTCAGVASR